MNRNFLQRIESIFRKDDLAIGVPEQHLGTAANRVAIVYQNDFDARQMPVGHFDHRCLRGFSGNIHPNLLPDQN